MKSVSKIIIIIITTLQNQEIFMQTIFDILGTIEQYLGSSQWFVYILLGTGVFFTVYLKFPQVRYFRHAVRVTKGKYDKRGDSGDTSHFGALATALSGTIGTGNIAGVALAIHLGGPAALFWMIVTALLGMCVKMVEVSLSLKYREQVADGTMSGGPMYYMKNGLGWKWLAVIFAVATIFSSFGTGCLPQINSIANSFEVTFGISKLVTGGVLALLLGLVVIGGIKRIAMVTSRLIPFMAVVYFLGGLSVLVYNYENILPSIASIFTDVFEGSSATGGFLGAGFAWAFNRGVNRGLFSNEAGQGSAPIAHSAAKTNEPVSEGIVATLEPFIDTVIICFMTGIILLSSGSWHDKVQNDFQGADTYVLAGESAEPAAVLEFLGNSSGHTLAYDGVVKIEQGKATTPVTVIHSRSIAEDVTFSKDGAPYSGDLMVKDARVMSPEVKIAGRSLLHSAPLTTEAFSRGLFGAWGRFIIPVSLLLFAFSTSIAWSYYGDRAVTFLFGVKWVRPYQAFYVAGIFFGAFTDTTIVWAISGITIAFMTLPNLIGILAMHKTMKNELKGYWARFRRDFPDEKAPKNW